MICVEAGHQGDKVRIATEADHYGLATVRESHCGRYDGCSESHESSQVRKPISLQSFSDLWCLNHAERKVQVECI